VPTENAETVFSGLSKNTVLLAAASLFADLATEMLTPILPIFLTQTLRTSGSIVGLVDGIAQAWRNIVDGFFGPVSDKLRKRKIIALAGYALAALGKPLMGHSSVWQGVLAGRLLDRSGAGTFAAPRDALVSSSTDAQYRGRGFGLESLGENGGAFLGPILTVLLLYELQVEVRTIFYLAFLPGLLAFAIILFVREPQAAEPPPKTNAAQYSARFPLAYWKFLFVVAVFSLGNSSNSFLILRTQEVSNSLLMTTLIYGGFNLVAALTSYPVGLLSDTWGRTKLLLASLGISFLVYTGFSFAQSIATTACFFLAYGMYEAGFRSMGRALAADLVPGELRASAMAWYSATAGTFQLVASIVGGVLWDSVGHTSTFVYGMISSAIGIFLGVLMLPRSPRQT